MRCFHILPVLLTVPLVLAGCGPLCGIPAFADDARCLPACGDGVCPAPGRCVDAVCVVDAGRDAGVTDAGPSSGGASSGSGASSAASGPGGSSMEDSSGHGMSAPASAASSGGNSSSPLGSSGPADAGAPDGCVPRQCSADAGLFCGTPEDGCGGPPLDCGACPQPGAVCGLFVPHRCDLPDTLAPTVRWLRVPPLLSRGQALVFHFAADDAGGSGVAGYTCTLDNQAPAACAPPVTLVDIADGPHTFSVVATDGAGNTGAPAQATFRVDTRRPQCAPSGVQACSAAADATVDLQCTDDIGVVATECAVDSGPFGPCTTDTTLQLTGLFPGPHDVTVRATDGAGNVSVPVQRRFEVDRDAPRVTLTRRPTLSALAQAQVAFVTTDRLGCGTVTPRCFLDNQPLPACGSPADLTVADGEHTFCVVATDTAGNQGSACTSWRVDQVPPTVTLAPVPDTASTTYDQRVQVPFTFTCADSGSGCAPSGVTCRVDGQDQDVTCGDAGGVAYVGGTSVHAFGMHQLQVTVTDRVGLSATASVFFRVTRCAGDMQFAHRTSNGLARAGCCLGLEPFNTFQAGVGFHPRADGACRPSSDRAAARLEGVWPGATCAPGLQRAQDTLDPGACGPVAGNLCVATRSEAAVLCGVMQPMGATQTPLGGVALEGPYPDPAAGCAGGTLATGVENSVPVRKRQVGLCRLEADRGELRDAVRATDGCAPGLMRFCRTLANNTETACVCAPADPYLNDGRN